MVRAIEENWMWWILNELLTAVVQHRQQDKNTSPYLKFANLPARITVNRTIRRDKNIAMQGVPKKWLSKYCWSPKTIWLEPKLSWCDIYFKHSSHFAPQQKRQRVNRTSRPASQSKTSKLQWSGEPPGIIHVSTSQVVKIRNPILSLQGSPGSPLLRKIRRQHPPPTPLHITYISHL